MPTTCRNTADALLGPVRAFLARPTQEGLFVTCEEEGVDLVLQVIAEAPAGLAGDCAKCGHRVRFERGRVDVKRACPLCRATLGPLAKAKADEKYNVFAWRAAWTRDGFAGLGHGATIDEGVFTEKDVLSGVSQMHSVLRIYLPLFEDANVTNMKDYRVAAKLKKGAEKADARLFPAARSTREGGATA